MSFSIGGSDFIVLPFLVLVGIGLWKIGKAYVRDKRRARADREKRKSQPPTQKLYERRKRIKDDSDDDDWMNNWRPY